MDQERLKTSCECFSLAEICYCYCGLLQINGRFSKWTWVTWLVPLGFCSSTVSVTSMAMAQFSSDMLCTNGFVDNAMFYTMQRMGQNYRWCVHVIQFTRWRQSDVGQLCLVECARWRHRGQSLPSLIASYSLSSGVILGRMPWLRKLRKYCWTVHALCPL